MRIIYVFFSKHITKTVKYFNESKSYNNRVRVLIRKRRNLKKFKSNSKNFLIKHKILTQNISEEIESYEKSKIDKIISKSDNFHSLYKMIKKVNKNQNQLSFKDENERQITDCKEIVEKFKTVFESKFVLNSVSDSDIDFNIDYQMVERVGELSLNMNDILFAINKFKINKSKGKTFIDNIVIKHCLNGVSKIFFALFTRILEFEKIPEQLKTSIVSPVLKHNKNKNLFTSYRCVSVQPNIYRIFESYLLNRLMPFITVNQIIPDIQYGYKKHVSLSDLHLRLQKLIFDSLIDPKLRAVDIVFLDFSDAFDSVSHQILLNKLQFYGFYGKVFNILKDIFKDRTQTVKFNDCFSTIISQKSGVMQGGVLSPVLFNIYIADIIQGLDSFVIKFADDLCVFRPVYNIDDCLFLQRDLDKIFRFCEKNFLKLNAAKCEHLRIGNRICDQFVYKINEMNVNSVVMHKFVGILYDCNLAFNLQIDEMIEKTLKKFAILKNICKRVDNKTFLRCYVTYLRPILEFANLSLVMTQTQSDRIESIQRKITKHICFLKGNSYLKYEERLTFCEIFSLKKRREMQTLKLVFKTLNRLHKIRNKFSENFVFYESSRNGVFCRLPTDYNQKDFFVFASKLFNRLPKVIRNEKSLTKFNVLLEEFL